MISVDVANSANSAEWREYIITAFKRSGYQLATAVNSRIGIKFVKNVLKQQGCRVVVRIYSTKWNVTHIQFKSEHDKLLAMLSFQ